MRIRMEESGGLAYMPGLQRPVEVDTDDLEPAEAARMEALADAAARDATSASPPAPGPDAREYRVTVTDRAQVRHVHVSDPLPSGAVAELVGWLAARREPPEGRTP